MAKYIPPIGYKNPPTHTRFQKGCSGNPAGRPRGSTNKMPPKTLQEILQQEAQRLVPVNEAGKQVRIPVIQVIARTLLLKAAKGDMPAQRLVLTYMSSTAANPPAAQAMPQAEMPWGHFPPGAYLIQPPTDEAGIALWNECWQKKGALLQTLNQQSLMAYEPLLPAKREKLIRETRATIKALQDVGIILAENWNVPREDYSVFNALLEPRIPQLYYATEEDMQKSMKESSLRVAREMERKYMGPVT